MRSFLPFLMALALVIPISAHSHKHNKKHAIPRNSHPVSHVNPQIHLIADENKPQQIMTSLTNTTGEMMVSWLTYAPYTKPVLEYNLQGREWIVLDAHTDSFLDPMNGIIMRYIYTVKIDGLKHSHNYSYRVGNQGNVTTRSEIMTFTTIPPPEQIVRLGIYGDFGLINSRSIQNLYTEVLHNHTIDMIVHVGDFAYDLHTADGLIGDAWLNMMTNITSHIPYMGCAGNHESKYNLTHYSKRFALWEEAGKQTKSGNNWWFSWDYQSGGATVHMVAINTEMYYDDNRLNDSYSMYPEQRKAQYEWLDTDLASARARNVDWLIVYGHRPIYCSNVDDMPDCSTDAQQLREGYPNAQGIREYGMEELLGKYNIDIYFTAHEHSYERTYPVFKNKYEVHDINTYINPKMPVHIVTGSTGCQENLDYYDTVMYGAWSVVRSSTYGYGHLLVHNKTHLYWDQMLAEGEQGRDVMWIVHQAPDDGGSSNISKGAAGGIVGGIIVSLIIGWWLWTTWYNKQVKAKFDNPSSTTVAHDERRDPLLLNASSV